MRVLRQRRHHDRQGLPGPQSESIRQRHPSGTVERPLPVPCAHTHDQSRQALRSGGEGMNSINRRTFLKTSGALVVTFSLTPEAMFSQRLDGASSNQLDGWLAINGDGTVTGFTGKCELGHGLYTAQTQLIAEELSVPFDRVKLIQCDTALTPDQGTTSGAQSHPTNFNKGSLALACATAREKLMEMASARLGLSKEQLAVKDGIVSSASDASKRATYAELIGGNKFNLTLNPQAKRKPASQWTVLGTAVQRVDIP